MMSIIIIESVGFSATQSISKMLQSDSKNYVSHGTKNFKNQTMMGSKDLSFSEFFGQMNELQDKYANCIAVHNNFIPYEIAKVTGPTDAKFFGLARRSQKKQILSCFYWAVKRFLDGDQFFKEQLSIGHNQYAHMFNHIGLQSNMITCLMVYAINHVVSYNIEIAKYAEKIFFMEDIIRNPNSFAAETGCFYNKNLCLNVAPGYSHKAKIKHLGFVTGEENVLQELLKVVKFDDEGQTYNLNSVESLLAVKAVTKETEIEDNLNELQKIG